MNPSPRKEVRKVKAVYSGIAAVAGAGAAAFFWTAATTPVGDPFWVATAIGCGVFSLLGALIAIDALRKGRL